MTSSTPRLVREPGDERYDDVRDVLLGRSDRVKLLASEPGTLAFFRGRFSLHRVPPVGGTTPRMNSVLTYVSEPGHKLSPMAQEHVLRPHQSRDSQRHVVTLRLL